MMDENGVILTGVHRSRRVKANPGVFAFVFTCAFGAASPSIAANAQTPEERTPTTRSETGTGAGSHVIFDVIDGETGEPVSEFSYNYWIETSQGFHKEWDDEWIPAQSAEGILRVDAPQSCSISLGIRAKHYTDGWGYPGYRTYVVKAEDKDRHFTVELTPGMVVRGVVKDEKTGQPVEGARISPVIFTPPGFGPDHRRSATGDVEGRFELRGVYTTLGIVAEHPDYLRTRIKLYGDEITFAEDGTATVGILLTSGPDLAGQVCDPYGKPLEGVQVSDGAGKVAETDTEGKFILRSPRKWNDGGDAYFLKLEKDGYVSQSLNPKGATPKALSIVLKPQPVVTGQVLDENGRPVRSYLLFGGPGSDPGSWECASAAVDDPSGRFAIRIREEGPTWIGVKVADYALSEKQTDTSNGTTPVVINLGRGCTIRATAVAPSGCTKPIKARLVPEFLTSEAERFNDELTQRQLLGSIDATAAEEGRIRLTNVHKGRYVLFVYGPEVTPVRRWLDVEEVNLDLGTIELQGTGTVFGQVYRQTGNVWAFADGMIAYEGCTTFRGGGEFSPLESISFRTDENGRFEVDGVPVGEVALSMPYKPTADTTRYHTRRAAVMPNKSTEVRFFDPGGAWDLPVQITVGDGSEAHWLSGSFADLGRALDRPSENEPWVEFHLTPLSTGPMSFPIPKRYDLAQQARLVIRDVHPGRYRLSVYMKPEGESRWEAEVEARPPAEPVRINLGAGSLIGRLQGNGEACGYIGVWLIKQGDDKHIRSVSCDEKGNFAMRFVQRGTYLLYAHDDAGGWCRIGPITVGQETLDVGGHQLQQGGSVSGKTIWVPGRDPPEDIPDTITATASNGVSIDIWLLDFDGRAGASFVFRNLWPDEWTITHQSRGKILSCGKARLRGTEDVQIDLVAIHD